ncbi:hypothetical protein QJQ45_015885 [Haematococcus lacustris]|nr:hypothetical protein QJQ45_015885 [Haematococcus lacustris]
MAQRRAAEAEAKAQALAAEAEAKAQADAGAYEAQLHQLQADLQQREQQVADTQRLQHAQQQLHDIQREEIQRKEQQALSPRPVWDLRTHRQQQQQQQQPLSPSPQAWQRRLQPMLDEFQRYTVEEGAELLDRLQQHRRMRFVVSQATGVVPPTPDQVLGGIIHARQTTICSMPEADVERMHDDVAGCRAMHRMVFTPDREQPKWAMAACACSTCMSVPCLPCMKPDTTTPLKPMPMFQDTVKEVREDEECYALLMLFHPDLLHDEVCFGKLTNTHCARYRMHMGWKREEGRRELRRLVRRELQSEELEAEYEADN